MRQEYRDSFDSIEKQLSELSNRLINVESKVNEFGDFIVANYGSYTEQKTRKIKNVLCEANFKTSQLESVEKIANVFREILDDREKLEKELEELKKEAEF